MCCLSIAILILFSPSAWGFRMNLRFAMSLDPFALHGRYSSIQLIGHQPKCDSEGDVPGAYRLLANPVPLVPGTSVMSPNLDMGGNYHPGSAEGLLFCLIFQLNEPGMPATLVRLYFTYVLLVQEGGGRFEIQRISAHLNRGGTAPRMTFDAPLDQLPYAGATFLDQNLIQLPLPIARIWPRAALGSIANLELLSQ
jgi:hypothetical protein